MDDIVGEGLAPPVVFIALLTAELSIQRIPAHAVLTFSVFYPRTEQGEGEIFAEKVRGEEFGGKRFFIFVYQSHKKHCLSCYKILLFTVL